MAVPRLRSLRHTLGRARRRVLRRELAPGLPDTSWVQHEANPGDARPLPSFRFFAVIGTWLEADVVDATVKNALVQGCERVYLVDNDSPDATVAVAEAAGAILARTFRTDRYDESERMRLMNEVVAEVSTQVSADEGAEHIWWLWLDADEFPHGPSGRTLREHLAGLDRRFRIVGARFFNHYPDRVPEHRPGHHPLEDQPLCEEVSYPMCTEGHRKHPLQRWDLTGPAIVCTAGFHQARADALLLEPDEPVFVHHFPFRCETVSRARLELLAGGGDGRAAEDSEATWHIRKRFRQLDDVYRHRWNRVESSDRVRRTRGLRLAPWTDQVRAEDASFAPF